MDTDVKVVLKNKKALHNYFILDRYEAGIVLTGTEIKSIRRGKINFNDSYARVSGGELYIEGMHISPYEEGNIFNVDPIRTRKLLLHKNQIRRLDQRVSQEGLTIVPLSAYLKKGRLKIELGLAKGKRKFDKRAEIAKKEAKRKIDRVLKNQ